MEALPRAQAGIDTSSCVCKQLLCKQLLCKQPRVRKDARAPLQAGTQEAMGAAGAHGYRVCTSLSGFDLLVSGTEVIQTLLLVLHMSLTSQGSHYRHVTIDSHLISCSTSASRRCFEVTTVAL